MNRLEAKVKAVNTAHAYANELFGKMKPVLEPFIGLRIFKVDGTLLAKVEKVLPVLANESGLRVYRHRSGYSLVWMVSANCDADGIAMYHEIGVYVGELSDGVLTGFYEPCNHRTDYTAEEITNKREVYKAARKAAENAMSALLHFGEYDR